MSAVLRSPVEETERLVQMLAEPTRAEPSNGIDLIYLGNADLADSCVWVPTTVTPGTTPLPIYPAPADLALIGGES